MKSCIIVLTLFTTGCLSAQAQPKLAEVAIIVAARDLAAGETLSADDFTRKMMPERLVTSSTVKPDSLLYILNQRMLVPALAGDPILWLSVETRAHPSTIQACTRALAASATAASQVASARAVVLKP